MNSQGRPTRPEARWSSRAATFTGNRALDMEEALIFEAGRFDATGVDHRGPPLLSARGWGRRAAPARPSCPV